MMHGESGMPDRTTFGSAASATASARMVDIQPGSQTDLFDIIARNWTSGFASLLWVAR